jgi:AcrR family transcriptional regulator
MSPRKYDMTRRASAVAQTRRRIVEATLELHGEQGIAATSWDDIAARAGVGVGTVYRHFRSLDELIPACGEITRQVVALPDPQGVATMFDGIDVPTERIELLVREAFAIYERGAPQLRAIRNEPDVHPNVAEAGEAVEASLSALIDAAVEPFEITAADRAVVRAMIDLNTWDALRNQELGRDEAVTAIAEMLIARSIAPGLRAPRRASQEGTAARRSS